MICESFNHVSAMAKTTGYTCAITADMLASGLYKKPGVHPLENVGADQEAFDFIIKELEKRKIVFEES